MTIVDGAHHSELRLEDNDLDNDSLINARIIIRNKLLNWLSLTGELIDNDYDYDMIEN